MKKIFSKPITWGGYFKLCGVMCLLALPMYAYYLISLFDVHPIEWLKEKFSRTHSTEV